MNQDPAGPRGLLPTLLALLLLFLLAAASFWVLRAFLMPMVWAVMLVVSTWPILLKAQARLRGRRALAAAAMTLLLLSVVVVPLLLVIGTLSAHSSAIAGWFGSIATAPWPQPPAWLGNVPLVGPKAAAQWQHAAAVGPQAVSAFLATYAGLAFTGIIAAVGTLGLMLVNFLLTLFIAAILYLRGEQAAAWVRLLARRISGRYGETSLDLAAKAIRAVALGIGVTALAQAVFAGVGMALCGVPGATILAALVFVLSLAQVGPLPVLAPAAIWLFWTGHPFWGTAMALWAAFVFVLGNVLGPLLMKKSIDLPMLLVFAGVIGGVLAFGVIGLFIGPLVLAVTYSLLDGWVAGEVSAD